MRHVARFRNDCLVQICFLCDDAVYEKEGRRGVQRTSAIEYVCVCVQESVRVKRQ